MKHWIALGLFLLPGLSLAQVAGTSYLDRCAPVLSIAGHDESSFLLSTKQRDVLYEHACTGKQVKEGLDVDAGISTFVDGLPLRGNLGASSRSEKMKSFCQTHNSTSESSLFSTGMSRSAVRESISAWASCMKVNTQVNISVSSASGPRGLLFEISRGKENVEFQGIDPFSANVKCVSTVPVNNPDGSSTEVTATSRLPINSGDELTITCERMPQQDAAGNRFYPPVELAVKTSRGSLIMKMPDDRDGPDFQSEWKKEKSELQGVIQDLISRRPTSRLVCVGGYGQERRFGNLACNPGEAMGPQVEHTTKPHHKMGWRCVTCASIVDGPRPVRIVDSKALVR
ncbi:hypothetical protein [Hydrogenophaga sp.]|uniref:hypothetical protein n=1 Tax=Hydrogenophaga sp. TaxID=1904254 RepID=UPI000DB4D82D|nr:hypothetical protein [Hydrogenophaga sp.]MDO9133987.1 hypothetical protein [Hydrogenophaga sp.]PZO10643.1 MAG: hypothetical protein DCF26_22695 [Burkholderiales bacterium]